ncbi:MAG TPA: hypothetical protein VJM46_02750 [Candidatus Saccharimonadales bacterium]|nr:hypothetical protein [Candidatus Saccharimonadales bacterium]
MNQFDPSKVETFEITGYDFDPQTGEVQLHYALLGEGEPITLTEKASVPVGNVDTQAAEVTDRLARLLLLAASVSYYKTAAPSRVAVRLPITEVEKYFLTEVIRRGMTEFAYVNNLPHALTPEIETSEIIPAEPIALGDVNQQHPLVAVGGGKDSIVTIEALRAAGFEPTLFSVNSYTPITNTVERAELPYLKVGRQIDATIGELNAQGALNGHVPITMINSLLALMTAAMNGLSAVVFSNERSASVGNLVWEGIDVNHQWAKSIEAEKLLQSTLVAAVSPSLAYFSLLRPLSELRIARQFATLEQYHDVFTSCNRAFHLDPSKRRIWCGECDKCRFVFLALAPYLGAEQLEAIWHKNMFEDNAQLAGFRELLGIEGHKPLECVGEIAESRLALVMAAQKDDWKHTALVPILLNDLPEDSLPTPEQEREIFETSEHLIPEVYVPALDQIK